MDRWNFRNVKRNILSSSRARNARRSGNPWRRRKRNGKSWRNLAAERKSLFLRRRKEAESEDKKIFKMLESLDFYSGGKKYKVGEAGLMFSYEIGREGRQLYIVALTEKFGTIIFYVPEGMKEKIEKRVQQIPYTLNDYLSFLIEFRGCRIDGFSIDDYFAALALARTTTDFKEEINNWLKMHGFPMRRKGRGKKKRE